MAKRIKPPPLTPVRSIDYSDCNNCIDGERCTDYPTLFDCRYSVTVHPNCNERKIKCVKYVGKK